MEAGANGHLGAKGTIWQSLSAGTTGVEASLALEASTGCPKPGVSPFIYYREGTWGWGPRPGAPTLIIQCLLAFIRDLLDRSYNNRGLESLCGLKQPSFIINGGIWDA